MPNSVRNWASVSATKWDDTVQKDEEAGESKKQSGEEPDDIYT